MSDARDREAAAGGAREARGLLHDFLRVVPRAQGAETVAVPQPDGSVCVLTREQVSAAVDALRPRVR